MTEDSLTGNQNAPLTLNRCVYADDNPMTMVDPTGRFTIDGDLVVVKGKPKVVSAPQMTSSVMAIPPNPPPSTASVTPSNIAPQVSTNTAASPPGGSALDNIISTSKDQGLDTASTQITSSTSTETSQVTSTTTTVSMTSTTVNVSPYQV